MTFAIFVVLLTITISFGAAFTFFRVGLLDGADQSPKLCATDGTTDCWSEVQFPSTTRFWIEIEPTYAATIEIGPVRSGTCNTGNDAYVSNADQPFANNTLAAFKAPPNVLYVSAKAATNALVVAYLPNCLANNAIRRYYVGVYQIDNGFLGTCPTGRFRLRVADASGICGYRRSDARCYEGQRACQFLNTTLGATVRSNLPVGDGWRCCPAKLAGQTESVTSTTGCVCGGLDHPTAPPLSPTARLPSCSVAQQSFKISMGQRLFFYCDQSSDYVAPLSDTKAAVRSSDGSLFQVLILSATNKLAYDRNDGSHRCHNLSCNNKATVWNPHLRIQWGGAPIYVLVVCASGTCNINVNLNLAATAASIVPVPGGRCQSADYCRNVCGYTSGLCCVDCSSRSTSTSCSSCSAVPFAPVTDTSLASFPPPTALPVVPGSGACQSTEYCRAVCGTTATQFGYGVCCADCIGQPGAFLVTERGCINMCSGVPPSTASAKTVASDGASGGGEVKICACGPNSCQGSACKLYKLNECVPFFSLCTGEPGGFVKVSGSDDREYSGSFFSDSACSGQPQKMFAAACGTCNTALGVRPACRGDGGSSKVSAAAAAARSNAILWRVVYLVSFYYHLLPK